MTPAAPQPASPVLVLETDPPGSGNFQGQYLNQAGTYAYIPEARWILDPVTKAKIREDTIFHRLNITTGVWDEMTLRAEVGYGIHLTSSGLLDQNETLLVTWNDNTGNALVEVPYRPGTVVTKKECKRIGVGLPGNLQVSTSPTQTRVAVRRIQAGTETYTRRSTAELRANEDRIFGVPIVVPRRADRVVQGFGVVNYELHIATGLHPHPARIETWDFRTGKCVGVYDAHQFGPLPTDHPAFTWVELEGVQGDKVSVKVGSGPRRRMRTFLRGILS